MSKVGTLIKIGNLFDGDNREYVITCKSCGKSKGIDRYKRSGEHYKCECTAILDKRGRVLDYGDRDIFKLAQNVKIEYGEKHTTKYESECAFCGKHTMINVGTKWFNCAHCNKYQSVGIICGCGGRFIPTHNTWAYRCVHCKSIVNSDGETIPRSRYTICGCCNEPIFKEVTCISNIRGNKVYKCSNCYAYNDSKGNQLFHEDVCTCKECNTLFEREKNRYRGNTNKMPLSTMYKCPGCESLLDFTGTCTEQGIKDKCNSCNITFSRVINANHPWLIQCPVCYEYVDEYGDVLAPNDIGKCKRCDTKQSKAMLREGCGLCGYTELLSGEVVCVNCNTYFDDEDLVGRSCIFCGNKIIKNE